MCARATATPEGGIRICIPYPARAHQYHLVTIPSLAMSFSDHAAQTVVRGPFWRNINSSSTTYTLIHATPVERCLMYFQSLHYHPLLSPLFFFYQEILNRKYQEEPFMPRIVNGTYALYSDHHDYLYSQILNYRILLILPFTPDFHSHNCCISLQSF